MKKSLSLILAIAMVFSMFATVALAADEPTTAQEMFDVLKAKGIFEGVNEQGDAALDKEMTRAEYAAVLVRLLGLEKKTGTPSYDDTANHWAHKDGYIEAVTPNYMEGTGPRQFSPDAPVTLEQLATIAVRALGLDIVQNPNVSGKVGTWVDDKGVSAAQYVATAIENGLISNVSDFTVNALREQLVITTYAADKVLSVPEKQTLVSAKQVGAKKVEVTFGRDVDVDTQVTVKKGSLSYTIDKAEANKNVLTVTLKDNISAGNYTVEASGVEGKAEFVGVAPVVGSIELLGDVLPQSDATSINYVVRNQFGEEMTPPSDLYWIPGNALAKITKHSDKTVTIDLKEVSNNIDLIRVDDLITVTVMSPNGVQASKTYKVGAPSTVSTIVLKDIKLPEDVARLTSNVTATVDFEIKDQYGNKIESYSELSKLTLISSLPNIVIPSWENNNGKAVLKLEVKEVSADLPVILTVVTGTGAYNSMNFTVYKPATIDRVEFVQPDGAIASGDEEGRTKIEIIAYDQYGNKLDRYAIARAYNVDKTLQIYPLGTTAQIVGYVQPNGDDRGLYIIKSVSGTGTVTLTAMVNGKTSSIDLEVREARYQHHTTVKSEGPAKLLQGYSDETTTRVGATSNIQLDIKDQYDVTQNNAKFQTKYKVSVTKVSGDDGNGITFETSGGTKLLLNEDGQFYEDKDADGKYTQGTDSLKPITQLNNFNVRAGTNVVGEYKLTIELINNEVTTGTWTKNFVVTDGKGENALTYEIADIPVLYKHGVDEPDYAADITLTAKDSDGNEVAVPTSLISKISVKDNTIANVDPAKLKVYGNYPSDTNLDADKSTVVTVVLNTPSGTNVIAKEVTVSKDDIELVEIKVSQNGTWRNKKNRNNDLLGDSSYKFELVDNFGKTTHFKSLNYVTFYITGPDGFYTELDKDDINPEKPNTAFFVFAGEYPDKYNITAVTYNGKVATATYEIKDEN